jgi:hypothetical protein
VAVNTTIGGDDTLFVGEDKVLRLELLDASSIPVNMTGMVLLFDVRLKDNSPDPAILSKTPSITGVYNAVRATNTQRAQVTLTDTDMNLFKAKTYRHSWKRMDDGSETVLSFGDFKPQKATAP